MSFKIQSHLPDLSNSTIEVNATSLLDSFKQTIARDDIGFFQITERAQYIDTTKVVFEKIKDKKHFVQIGIGGSALGPQMLVSSLGKKSDKTFSLLDNTDADYIFDTLSKIDLKDSLFYVVSKSGGTAETIACYSIVRNLLKDAGISEEKYKDYFVFCTDKNSGQLREHVDKHGYTSLEVPSDVGGRYSVLTPVGLLPALFMGIDIEKLYEGAEELKKEILSPELIANPLVTMAKEILTLREQCPMTVFMPYSSKLKDLSFWFIQLWAESLGKFSEELNKPVGLTPIPAYGATDQHSQMQLFMEGPNDKLILLLHIKNKKHSYALDSGLDLDSAKKLSQFSMNELIEAEYIGTVKALEENKRNLVTIGIDQLNEKNLAKLILFFESLTVMTASGLLIDPFNQPGVEKGKKYTFEYLNSLRK